MVNLRLHTENQLYTLPRSALKVCVVGDGWWWWWVVGVESEFSDQLWLWPSRTKICEIVATFVYASSQGQRTHYARTKMLLCIGCEPLKFPLVPIEVLALGSMHACLGGGNLFKRKKRKKCR